MPTSFLTREQRETFGRFTRSPSPEELARYFHLDGRELNTARQMRGMTNRLGFAVLLCSVKFVGTLPNQRRDIPEAVIAYLCAQLGGATPQGFEGYFDTSSPTYKRHTAVIRNHFGYRDFHSTPGAILGVSRRIYAFCWAGEDRPGHLIKWASDWLIASKVLLPGVSTLERLVGRIRERARLRLWQRLVEGLSDAQRTQIEALFDNDGERFG